MWEAALLVDWKAVDFPGFVAVLQASGWPAWGTDGGWPGWVFVDFEAGGDADPLEALHGVALGRWASC